ncbi:MAG: tryptophan-rich sensory protein [Spirochaetes bacterium]|nr:tryptophan-rich sensory protein [Spirochaetota bacterium]MBU1078856.1 tryptophan-rich sensory protein [Spirochaetota bacterium]
MNTTANRKAWGVATAAGFTLMITLNALANALPLNGVNTGQLSDEIPNLFVPTGLTFAIWGVIYLLLLGYVVAALRDAFSNAGGALWDSEDGKLFSANASLNAAWILAWHWRSIALSLLIMVGILATLIAMMERNHARGPIAASDANRVSRFLLRVPVLVYLGWICVATIANVTAFLVTIGWNGFGIPQLWWAVLVVAVGAIVGGALVLGRGAVSSGLVVIWAYAGIVIKRSATDPSSTAPLIVAAYIGIAAVAVAIILRLYLSRKAVA